VSVTFPSCMAIHELVTADVDVAWGFNRAQRRGRWRTLKNITAGMKLPV